MIGRNDSKLRAEIPIDVATATEQRFVVDGDGNVFYEQWDAEDFATLMTIQECPMCYRRTGGAHCSSCISEGRVVRLVSDHPLLVRGVS